AGRGLTKHAVDGWESARFTIIFLASGFFYISNRIHARPTATNANRELLTTLFHFLSTQSSIAILKSLGSPNSSRSIPCKEWRL
ncbi:MAG: hypothetical protein NTV38_00940, partial [Chloroflexi bacterium]|nr:hypothetical protein [Chloroflexota bacterium]